MTTGNTPLNADELDNFMHGLGFFWDSYQSVWRNDGRKQYDRDYDDSISMGLAKQLLAGRKKHELHARLSEATAAWGASCDMPSAGAISRSLARRKDYLKQELEKL